MGLGLGGKISPLIGCPPLASSLTELVLSKCDAKYHAVNDLVLMNDDDDDFQLSFLTNTILQPLYLSNTTTKLSQ